MVVSDINIMCVGAKKPLFYEDKRVEVTIYDRNRCYNPSIYSGRYIQAQKMAGIWYKLEPCSRASGNYEEEFFDLKDRLNVVYESSYIKDIITDFVSELLYVENTKYVIFFIDLEGYSTETCELSFDEFHIMTYNDALKFNMEYHISK